MTPTERFRSTRYWPALDGLRAIAVLLVIGYHATAGYDPIILGGQLFRFGDYGVQIFFAISGFLITTLLLRERSQSGSVDLGRFYARRAARIFPLYYATLGLYILLVWRFEPVGPVRDGFWHHLPAFLTYTSNWAVYSTPGRVIFVLAWSLAVEEQFYLIWPSVVRHVASLRVLAVLALVAMVHWYFRAIGLGCVLAIALHAEWPVARLFARPIMLPLSLGGLLAVLLNPALGGAHGWTGTAVAVTLVGAAALHDTSIAGRVLSSRPMRHVGQVSYGMYLLNLLALHLARHVPLVHGYALAGAGVLIAIGAATASHRWFEQPIRDWARECMARRSPAALRSTLLERPRLSLSVESAAEGATEG